MTPTTTWSLPVVVFQAGSASMSAPAEPDCCPVFLSAHWVA
jgi:hypothetical protein